MAIDVKEPQSPGWWLKRCADKLEVKRERIEPLYQRYEGKQPLPESLVDAPEAARRFFKSSRTSFAELIVKAPRYRTRVTAILTDQSEVGDKEAGELWRTSGMRANQHDIHRNCYVAGDAYGLASMYQGELAATAEDPRQVITIHDPVRQSIILAGSKWFHSDVDGADFGYLYLNGRRYVATHSRRAGRGSPRFTPSSWDWSAAHGGGLGEAIPVRMPLVRYRNEEGVGEIERHTDLLDRIDHLTLQGMVIATLQAFKQRAIKVDPADMPDIDEDTGEEIDYNDVFTADPGALWKLPATAEMWESGTVDLNPLVSMQKAEFQRLSAVTFTPMSMLSPDATNQSATGASLVREGLTTKVEDRQDRLSDDHEQMVRLLYEVSGKVPPAVVRVRWAPAERYSLLEMADAVVKYKAGGVPWRTRMRLALQMDPDEIDAAATERADDLILFPAEVEVGRGQESDLAGA